MSSEAQVPGSESGAPASPPAQLTEDRILEIVTKAFDARIPGLMSAFDKQISAIKKDVEGLRLSPDEIEDRQRSELEAKLAQAERVAAAATAALQNPEVFPVYEKLMSAESGEEQISILAEFMQQARAAQPAPQQEQQQEEGATPPVDPNRPLTTTPFTGQMNAALADQILSQFERWPTED